MSDALLAAALDAHRRGQCDVAAERYEALTTDLTLPAALRTDAFYWRGVAALQQFSALPAPGATPHATSPDIALISVALRAFDAALALYPAHPAAQLNRGHAFRQTSQRDAARAAYAAAISLCGIRLRDSELSEGPAATASAPFTSSTASVAVDPSAPPREDAAEVMSAPRSAACEPQVAAAALSALGSLHAEEAGAQSGAGTGSASSTASIDAGTAHGDASGAGNAERAGTIGRSATKHASALTAADRIALLAKALACFDAALQCADGNPATHDQRGLVLAALGRYTDAETAHRRALTLQAGHPGVLNNLAIALKAQGRLDEAAAAFRDALRRVPDFVPALINLGQTVALQGEHDQATAPLLRAAQLAPDLDLVHCELAQAFHAQGKDDAALHHAERAVEIAPEGPTGWQNLGVARFETGDAAGAAKAFDRVIALTPVPVRAAAAALSAAPSARDNSGTTRSANSTGAMDAVDPVQRLAPIYALARFSRACLLLSDGGSPAGWRQFEARLALGEGGHRAPAPVRSNGSPLPRWLGEPVGQHRMPVPSRPAAQGSRNVASARLASASASRATPAESSDASGMPSTFDKPATSGESEEAVYLRLPGRTLLVLAEQGYGDTMQFLRFIGCLTARGANVVLALQPALRPLMNDDPATTESARSRRLTVITHGVDPLPSGIDAYCRIGSLPACLRIGKLPRPGDAGMWTTPYLFAPVDAAIGTTPTDHHGVAAVPTSRANAAVNSVAKSMAKSVSTRSVAPNVSPRGLKIGFAWSGRRPGATAARAAHQRSALDPSHKDAAHHASASDEDFDNAVVRFDKRAIPLDEMAPLLNLANTEWHPLQTDIRADEYALLDALSEQARIVLPEKPAVDFATTARRIAALDHVVTIDTSIAHLAGAMGKPTTLLLSCVADWRWCGSEGPTGNKGFDISLWYPSIRIVRQPRNGDWTSVIDQAASLLDSAR